MRSEYQYLASFHRPGQAHALGQMPLEVDWLPAEECVRFAAFRLSPEEPAALPAGEVSIEPIWQEQAGEPYLAGVRAGIQTGDEWIEQDLEAEYFMPAAMQAASRLIDSGMLRDGENVQFLLYASRKAGPEQPCAGTQDSGVPLPTHAGDFERLLRESSPLGENDPEDVPVFVSAGVVDEIVGRAASPNPEEAGGLLIGRMYRDPLDAQMLFFAVTAQVPARLCICGPEGLAFSPQAWAAAAAAIRLRKQGEMCGGWWHCHPAGAVDGGPRGQRELYPLLDAQGSLSMAGEATHRAGFARALNIALVATHRSEERLSCFGWRRGRIVRRGLRIIGAGEACEPQSQRGRGTTVSGDLRNGSACK